MVDTVDTRRTTNDARGMAFKLPTGELVTQKPIGVYVESIQIITKLTT